MSNVSVKVTPPWGLYTGGDIKGDRSSPSLRNAVLVERPEKYSQPAPNVEIVSTNMGALGSPRQFITQRAEEERDKRSVSEMLAEEKKILRHIEMLQKSEESLKGVLADMKRSKGKKGPTDPLFEAKEEELLLKQRVISEQAASLKKIRDIRVQLESALSEKKLASLLHKSRERVSQAMHRDPSLVLASFREEESRLAEQERALELALADELEAEEMYEKEQNNAGAHDPPPLLSI